MLHVAVVLQCVENVHCIHQIYRRDTSHDALDVAVVLQRVAVCCNVLQCVAVVLQCVENVHCIHQIYRRDTLHDALDVAVMLQRVAVCCNVLQCVAVCCSGVAVC